MADSTIQVLEGLFATPIIAEDEYGNPIAAVETGVPAAGGLKPTFSTLAQPPTISAGALVLTAGLLYFLFRQTQED